MHTLMWWTVWGLVVGIGLFGLKESSRASLHLILALPLLSGAAAAAILRVRHEYQEALQHAKWLAISSGFLLLGSGYLYLRTEAFGPFATGTQHKAFLESTFEMSVPEVERAIGRKLSIPASERQDPDGLKEWVLGILPLPERPPESRTLNHLIVYGVPGEARFEFTKGKLGKIELVFDNTSKEDTGPLLRRIRDDLEKTYKPAEPAAVRAPFLYRKEAVEAVVDDTVVDSSHEQVQVRLTYLPFLEKEPGPLTVNAQVF
jgi:hypothetical protein